MFRSPWFVRLLPRVRAVACVASLLPLGTLGAAAQTAQAAQTDQTAPDVRQSPDAARQHALLRMVRQDCGSCHGMQLTGGLGPPLTPEPMARLTAEGIFLTLLHGRPGTPMPTWRALLSEPEMRWIAARLIEGLPAGAGMGAAR